MAKRKGQKRRSDEDKCRQDKGRDVDSKDTSTSIPYKYPCGVRLSKWFPKTKNNPTEGWFDGTISDHYYKRSGKKNQYLIYLIQYDDGDVEELFEEELDDDQKVKIHDEDDDKKASSSKRKKLKDDTDSTLAATKVKEGKEQVSKTLDPSTIEGGASVSVSARSLGTSDMPGPSSDKTPTTTRTRAMINSVFDVWRKFWK